MATLSIDARLCYRFRWLGGVTWEIPDKAIDAKIAEIKSTCNV